jgi:hypothetical protein
MDQTGFYVDKHRTRLFAWEIKNSELDMKPGWRPIINSDIKPGNVVLGKAHEGYYPAFKVAKMIDYGLAWDDGRFTIAAHKTRAIGRHGFNPPVSLSHSYSDKIVSQEVIDMLSGTILSGLSSVPRYPSQHSKQRMERGDDHNEPNGGAEHLC